MFHLEFAAEVTEVLALCAREAALYLMSELIRCAWLLFFLYIALNDSRQKEIRDTAKREIRGIEIHNYRLLDL